MSHCGHEEELEQERQAHAETRRERDALQRHYDAAAPEHNLLALLDLYAEREADAHRHAVACEAGLQRLERTSREIVAVVEAAKAYRDAPCECSLDELVYEELCQALDALAAKEKEAP